MGQLYSPIRGRERFSQKLDQILQQKSYHRVFNYNIILITLIKYYYCTFAHVLYKAKHVLISELKDSAVNMNVCSPVHLKCLHGVFLFKAKIVLLLVIYPATYVCPTVLKPLDEFSWSV